MKYLIPCLTIILILQCSPVMHIAQVEEANVNISNHEADESITQLISPYKQQLDAEMNEVIGKCVRTMTKQKPESTLGNWFCDLMYIAAKESFDQPVAFAVQNYGGLRIPSINKGEVTKRKIYELMPFDNTLVLVQLGNDELIKFINQMAASNGWPQSAQLKYNIKNKVATEITIQNKAINADESYWVAMPDYIANGGDNAFYLMDNPRQEKGTFLRDLVIEQVQQNTKNGISIEGTIDGRVTSAN